MVSSSPVVSEPSLQRPMPGIPPISFKPEMPALPRKSDDEGSPTSQIVAQDPIPSEPELPAEKEPIQVAKVMPQKPEEVEIMTETLEAALSDVYFDYDRFAIRDDAMQLLKANAKLLSEKLPEANIVIEGHCDERGTQSYNMVLGEARANAVKTFLEDLGISGDKLEVVSYGKDKPFCKEQSEECWQENRRGHFVIK